MTQNQPSLPPWNTLLLKRGRRHGRSPINFAGVTNQLPVQSISMWLRNYIIIFIFRLLLNTFRLLFIMFYTLFYIMCYMMCCIMCYILSHIIMVQKHIILVPRNMVLVPHNMIPVPNTITIITSWFCRGCFCINHSCNKMWILMGFFFIKQSRNKILTLLGCAFY